MRLKGTLGFLGCGNMGMAILRGLTGTGTIEGSQALVYDPDPARQDEVRQLGAKPVASPADLARQADILLLAVKPQIMGDALDALGNIQPKQPLVISIAAGISLQFLQDRLGPETRVARVMPNTPALVGAGAAAYAVSETCTAEDDATVRAIFEAVGIAERVEEALIDTVTALSGSGPAYFFYMVECLVDAATRQGMPADTARRLAGQTLLGAGRLLAESGEPADELRRRVTSKGGTTEAALNAFRAAGFDEVVRSAVDAAAARSRELGR